MTYTQDRRVTFREKPQDTRPVQASFLDMVPVSIGFGPRPRVRRPARRVDVQLRQLTFADLDEAWV